MKILLITPMPPSPEAPGAIPLVLYAQLAGLAGRHQITLVTPVGNEPGEREAASRLLDMGLEVHAVPEMQMHRLARWQRRWRLASGWLKGAWPWRTVWFWNPQVQETLDRLLAEERFDLLAVEDNAMGAYRYHTQTPKVFSEHEVRRSRPFHWPEKLGKDMHRQLVQELDWRRWPAYQKRVWQRFERIEAFTRRDADAIQRMAPELAERVRVNPFGVVIPAPADPLREVPGRVVFTGNFTHAPNVDAALWLGKEIMPRLRQRSPGVHIYLVGIYPPKEIQELASLDIHVTGPVEEINPVLEEAAVVAAPIRTGGGMRMKVLHAMARGKAVVTSPRGAEGLAIDGQQPPLSMADDAAGFADCIANLLANPVARRDLGQSARSYVMQHFSPQAYARRTEVIWQELVVNGSSLPKIDGGNER